MTFLIPSFYIREHQQAESWGFLLCNSSYSDKIFMASTIREQYSITVINAI